jgi:uncharacterized membrane protein
MKSSRRQHIVLRRSTGSDAVGAGRKGSDVQTSASRKTSAPPVQTLDENIAAIKGWEEESLHHRSRTELLSDAITRFAAGGPVLLFHVAWFNFWILANLGSIPGVTPFDPFPFPLLTMTVSLEAIFLSLFVLASQNRLSHQADKREHLDLQIDLLAEREMTTVLKLLQDIARHLGAKVSVTPDQIRDLAGKTDLDQLTHKMEEIPEPGSSKPAASEDLHRKAQ